MAFWKKIFTQEKEPGKERAVAPAAARPAPDPREAEAKNASPRAKAQDIFFMPHLTEKASALGSRRQYVFTVPSGANKLRVRQAVAVRYGVTVESVRILNMPAKERRRGRQIGWKPGFKKAIVRLQEGQEIQTR